MELLKDYDFLLQYHPSKAKIVTDALTQKPRRTVASLMIREWQAFEMMAEFGVQLAVIEGGRNFGVHSSTSYSSGLDY